MKEFFKFWQKDIINKLIVLALLGVVAGIIGLAILFTNIPAGKSFNGAIGDYFPTATQEPRVLLTRYAEKAMTQTAIATASVPPTITTMPFKTFKTLPPDTETVPPATSQFILPPSAIPAAATATLALSTATPTKVLPTPSSTRPAPTNIPTLVRPTPSPTPQAAGTPVNLACIPANPPQKGKVLSVIDGNTIKVLINGFAYNVRYIGIQVPANKNYALLASITNGDLVFAEQVTLIPDVLDKDERGFLLRYVQVGDMVPSMELLKKGLATAVDTPPNSACAQAFKSLEQSARDAKIGIWLPPPSQP